MALRCHRSAFTLAFWRSRSMSCFYRGCNDEQVSALASLPALSKWGQRKTQTYKEATVPVWPLFAPSRDMGIADGGIFHGAWAHKPNTHTRFALSRRAGGQICPAEMSHPISICHTHPPQSQIPIKSPKLFPSSPATTVKTLHLYRRPSLANPSFGFIKLFTDVVMSSPCSVTLQHSMTTLHTRAGQLSTTLTPKTGIYDSTDRLLIVAEERTRNTLTSQVTQVLWFFSNLVEVKRWLPLINCNNIKCKSQRGHFNSRKSVSYGLTAM